MTEKHRWSYEEDYLCCIRYLEFVFDNVGDDSLDKLVEIYKNELPHIKRGSLRMKAQNIKQLALESGLEDRLEIAPLYQYSEQSKRAFYAAIREYEKRVIPVPDDEFILSDDNLDDEEMFRKRVIGANVTHKIFGKGKILALEGKCVIVEFAERISKLVYPEALYKFLTFEDEGLKELAQWFGDVTERRKKGRPIVF